MFINNDLRTCNFIAINNLLGAGDRQELYRKQVNIVQ